MKRHQTGRWTMTLFIVRRLAGILGLLIVVSALIFFLAQMLPGDLARSILGPQATPAQYAALNARLGLDQPAIVRYLDWGMGVLRGDWGTSLIDGRSVGDIVASRLGASARLALLALLILVPLAFAAGTISGLRENSAVDRVIGAVGSVLLVVPEFVTGILLILLFGVVLGVLPTSSTLPPNVDLLGSLRYLILPALCVVFAIFGYLTRMVRAETIEVSQRPFVRTARFKGLHPRRVMWQHVVRNALPTSVSIAFLQAGFIFAGLIVVEQLFAFPGLGKLVLDAASSHDVTVLQGAALTVSLLILVAAFLGDLMLLALDPRARTAVRA